MIVQPDIIEEIKQRLASLEKIEVIDGVDGLDGRDGRDGADGRDGRDGSNGIDGKDGVVPSLNDVVSKVREEMQKVPIHLKDIKGVTELVDHLKMGGYRGGGLSSVAHDATLTGDGTIQNPLHVVSSSTLSLEVNGTLNGSQSLLNLVQGTGMAIVDDGFGNITFTASGSGGISIGETIMGGDPNDVLFIDAFGNLAQNDNFTYDQIGFQTNITNAASTFNQDGTTGTTTISSYGIVQMQVSDNTGIQQFGDIGYDWYQDMLNINGPAQQIILQHAGYPYLSIDNNARRYSFGDSGNFLNGTALVINDGGGLIAGIGSLGSINGFNLDFINQVYTLGEAVGSNATYIQNTNISGTSTFVSYGNVIGNGTTGIGLGIDYIGGQYGMGDLSRLNNQTSLIIDDINSLVTINGQKGVSYNVIPFTGTGLDDLTWGGAYTGPSANNYNVWIDSNNNFLLNYNSETGLLTPGEPVSNGTGVSGTLVSDDGAGNVLITDTVGGTWLAGDSVTGSTSGNSFTVTSSTLNPDTFAWQDTLGNTGAGVVITAAPQLLSFGITINYGAPFGHDLGASPTPGPFLGWEEDISISFGRMMVADGQNEIIQIGDVDGVGNTTQIIIDDTNLFVYATNSFSTSEHHGVVSANTDTALPSENKFNLKFGGMAIKHFINSNVKGGTDFTVLSVDAGTILHNDSSVLPAIRIMCPGSTNFDVFPNTFFKVYYTNRYTDNRPAFIIHDINYA